MSIEWQEQDEEGETRLVRQGADDYESGAQLVRQVADDAEFDQPATWRRRARAPRRGAGRAMTPDESREYRRQLATVAAELAALPRQRYLDALAFLAAFIRDARTSGAPAFTSARHLHAAAVLARTAVRRHWEKGEWDALQRAAERVWTLGFVTGLGAGVADALPAELVS